MAQLNLCFQVAFLAVLLPLTSGEHCIILNQLERFHFYAKIYIQGTVAVGFLSRSQVLPQYGDNQYQKETKN